MSCFQSLYWFLSASVVLVLILRCYYSNVIPQQYLDQMARFGCLVRFGCCRALHYWQRTIWPMHDIQDRIFCSYSVAVFFFNLTCILRTLHVALAAVFSSLAFFSASTPLPCISTVSAPLWAATSMVISMTLGTSSCPRLSRHHQSNITAFFDSFLSQSSSLWWRTCDFHINDNRIQKIQIPLWRACHIVFLKYC